MKGYGSPDASATDSVAHLSMRKRSVRYATFRFLGVLGLVLAIAGCGGAATTTPSEQPTSTTPAATSTTTTAPSPLAITSSIADGTNLTTPTAWIATVTGQSAVSPVDRVEFLIDGDLMWVEQNLPYSFNDDGNLFVPSVLDPGSHLLSVDVYTSSGVAATSEANVTTTRPSVPAELEGKGFKHQAPEQQCATCDVPDGVWRIEFGADGVIRFDDPLGGKGTEAFEATSDGVLTLYGPTSWIVPEEARGGFCDPNGIATMNWQISGADLILSASGTDDPCPGRAGVFTGTYQPSS